MLLTISQPTKAEFGGRFTHDFSPRIPLAKSRLSPQPLPKIDSPVNSLRASIKPEDKMSTPHRGLPPPSAMTLPDPGRPPPPPLSQMPGAMPPPPPQWQGQEESMRWYLAAKSEEDKRKQEEERTRQENFRLEQRKIEQSMLRDSLNAGIPPAMVPMIYAGIGGSNLANVSFEWLQQYFAQLQTAQQQLQQQPSPELRRETRLIGPGTSQYISQAPPQQVLPSQHPDQSHPPPLQTTFSAYQGPPNRPPPTSAPRSAVHTQLPRLTTNEMYIQQPPPQGPGSAHPLQQSQTVQQDQAASSPSIYFHHWVPPNESKTTQPQTPASRGEPLSAHPGSHLSESDYKESPRKRKAQGPHQPAPPPSSAPSHTSPAFSNASSTGSARRAGHVRSRSNTSAREHESRPDSRRDPEPRRASQQESAPTSGELPSMPHNESTTSRSSAEAPRDYRVERPDSRDR